MNPELMQWAIKHKVSFAALSELRGIFGTDAEPLNAPGAIVSEAAVQSIVRLEAARKGLRLWRNNVGALLDTRGVPVRYGLANDTAALNKTIKSGDLIGWRPVLITAAHIGTTIAQFVSRECKKPGWHFIGDDHERAQLRWLETVARDGGDAKFCSGEGTL